MRKNTNIDLTGRRFGKLTVVKFSHIENKIRKWLCRCDCGTEKVIYEHSFSRGTTKSCGCYRRSKNSRNYDNWSKILTKEYLIQKHKVEKLSFRQIAKEIGCSSGCISKYADDYGIDVNDLCYEIIGQKFGRLTVISRDESKVGCGSSYWNVECECGTHKSVRGALLIRCSVISCGCYNKEKEWKGCGDLSKSYISKVVKSATKRNLEFGITIEYAWDLFLRQNGKCALSGTELVMDRSYAYNHGTRKKLQTASLDRIDSKLGYIVGNVQWVHRTLNVMKSNLMEDEFIEWCRKVSEYRSI